VDRVERPDDPRQRAAHVDLDRPVRVLLVTIDDLREAERTVRDSDSLLVTANELERLVVDLETGVRGFVITGNDQFLQPFSAARGNLPATADGLIRLSGGQPEQTSRARQITQAASSYVRDYALPLLSMVRNGDPAAGSLTVTAEGKRRLDAIRSQFTSLIATERGLSLARQQRTDAEARRAVIAAIGGLALSLLLVLGFTGYLARAIVRPVRRAGQMAIRLAGGDLAGGCRQPEWRRSGSCSRRSTRWPARSAATRTS
jgi:CHASE3 domain sensor protein